jgi:hypothetical protein
MLDDDLLKEMEAVDGKNGMPADALSTMPPLDFHGLPPIVRTEQTSAGRKFRDLSKPENAIATIERLPKTGESIHFLLGGYFIGLDMITAILAMKEKPAEKLIISTLGFSQANISTLCSLVAQARSKTLHLIVSHYFKGVETGAVDEAKALLARHNVTVSVARCHAKVAIISYEDGDRYIIETSANLRSCQSIEQATLTHSASLFAFHEQWMEQLINHL